ncbi:MAG: HepT-like ribonuclease domain-containing protein [Beijerinckiaceae bacterium]
MNVPRDYRDFLNDMAEACGSIIRFVEGMTLDAYLADEKTRYAVMRGYEIMGEAVRHLPEDVKSANPEIPWATMAAVRNRIVHGYFGVDDTILFTTVDEELKALLPRLEALAREYGAGK